MNFSKNKYTCREYREEMILLSLKQKLASPDLSKEEKIKLEQEIKDIEKSMDM